MIFRRLRIYEGSAAMFSSPSSSMASAGEEHEAAWLAGKVTAHPDSCEPPWHERTSRAPTAWRDRHVLSACGIAPVRAWHFPAHLSRVASGFGTSYAVAWASPWPDISRPRQFVRGRGLASA
jgi:hypothetical protein